MSAMDESGVSSGSRSSLGDTRSIVLALQALQEKIRKLEIDRNYHQEQCERARANHEEYKRDVEAQLDRERAEHRRREQELQELISRANAERTTLQSTLEESRRDISQFRAELEVLLDRERRDAMKRDEKLQLELNQLHAELAKEKRNAEHAQKQLEQARAEKETMESTNRRLEDTVADLIAMNNTLMQKKGGKDNQRTSSAAATGRSSTSIGVGEDTHVRSTTGVQTSRTTTHVHTHRHLHPTAHNASTVSVGARLGGAGSGTRPSSAQVRRSSASGDKHYTAPTFNSSQRCERFATHESSFLERRSGSTQRTVRTSTPPPQPQSLTEMPHPRRAEKKIDERLEALDELYQELQLEYQALNSKYTQVIRKASEPDANNVVSPGQLTAELNAIMSQIDRKTEQMQMVRQSRERLEREGGDRPGKAVPGKSVPRGFDKATRKTALMNELRSLFNRTVQHA